MKTRRLKFAAVFFSLTAIGSFSSCVPQAAFTSNNTPAQNQLDMEGHPDLPSSTDPTNSGTPPTMTSLPENPPAPGTNPGTTPTSTPPTMTSNSETPPAPTPSVTPPSTPPTTTSTSETPPPPNGKAPSSTPPSMGSNSETPPPGKKPPSVSPTPTESEDPLVKYACGAGKSANAKKILICHVPRGNPSQAHDICIAVEGAVSGHGIDLKTCKSPVGDYCGSCNPDDEE